MFQFQVVKFDPKNFRQRHRGADGKWIWNLKGIQKVLYRLPELIDTYADQDALILAAHFTGPTAGRIVSSPKGARFKFLED